MSLQCICRLIWRNVLSPHKHVRWSSSVSASRTRQLRLFPDVWESREKWPQLLQPSSSPLPTSSSSSPDSSASLSLPQSSSPPSSSVRMPVLMLVAAPMVRSPVVVGTHRMRRGGTQLVLNDEQRFACNQGHILSTPELLFPCDCRAKWAQISLTLVAVAALVAVTDGR